MARPVTEFTSFEWCSKWKTNRVGAPSASKKVVCVPLKKSTKLSWNVPQSMTSENSAGGSVSCDGGRNDAAPAVATDRTANTIATARTAHAARFMGRPSLGLASTHPDAPMLGRSPGELARRRVAASGIGARRDQQPLHLERHPVAGAEERSLTISSSHSGRARLSLDGDQQVVTRVAATTNWTHIRLAFSG